jgi:hypothetical protein
LRILRFLRRANLLLGERREARGETRGRFLGGAFRFGVSRGGFRFFGSLLLERRVKPGRLLVHERELAFVPGGRAVLRRERLRVFKKLGVLRELARGIRVAARARRRGLLRLEHLLAVLVRERVPRLEVQVLVGPPGTARARAGGGTRGARARVRLAGVGLRRGKREG